MYKNKLQIITLKKDNITDFSEERNKLLNNSKSEWVFFLDSDERISGELGSEIDQAIKINKYNGFYVFRKNFFLGKFIGKDKLVRLGKKESGLWTRRVHEEWHINGRIGTLKNPIIHNTAIGLKSYIAKINIYSRLHAMANQDKGKKSRLV